MNWMDVLVALQGGAIAGVMVILSTGLVEKLGGRIGGVIASMPFTILPASYTIINSAKTDLDYLASLCSLPVNCFGGIVFLEVWKILPRFLINFSFWVRLVTLSLTSVVLWTTYVTIVTYCMFEIKTHIKYMLPTAVSAWLVHLCLGCILSWNIPPSKKGKNKIGVFTYFCRGLVAFVVIAIASLIARIGQSLFATVVSMFPAILLTTMISMYISQGEDVGLGAVGPLMVGGNAWACYGALLALLRYLTTLPTLAVIAMSCIGSICLISIPTTFYLSWRERKSNPIPKQTVKCSEIVVELETLKNEETENLLKN